MTDHAKLHKLPSDPSPSSETFSGKLKSNAVDRLAMEGKTTLLRFPSRSLVLCISSVHLAPYYVH